MRLLVDTHVLIWWWADDDRLPERLRLLLGRSDTTVFVSAASALEMAIKVRIGKLPEMEPFISQFEEAIAEDRFAPLAIRQDHALSAGGLPGNHKDPFDRIIAAQSLAEGLPVVTRDAAIAAFGCEVFW